MHMYEHQDTHIFLLVCPSGVLPPNTEEFDEKKGLKKITEFKYNEEGKVVKVSLYVM